MTKYQNTKPMPDDLLTDWISVDDIAPYVKLILFNLFGRIEGLYNCTAVDQFTRSHQGESLCSIVNGRDIDDHTYRLTNPRASMCTGLKTNGALEQLYALLDALYEKKWMKMSTLPLAALGNTLSSSEGRAWMSMTYGLLGRALVGQ
jgi:hypothetical protein